MQQTIQFGQVQPSVLQQLEQTVKSAVAPVQTTVQGVQRAVARAKAWCQAHQEAVELYVGGPVIVATGLAMVYMAAVLQGGAS